MAQSLQSSLKWRSLGTALLRRTGGALLVLWGAATLSFLVLYLLPGDPVDILLGNDPNATEAIRAQIREKYHLDRPIIEQYFLALGNLLRGNLGTSYQLHQPVAQIIGSELMPTVWLAIAAALLAVVISPVLAVLTYGNKRLRSFSHVLELLAISTPSFWLGLLLLTLFSFTLKWVPLNSDNQFVTLILPAIALSLGLIGTLTQVLRNGLEYTMAQPFVLTARARGLSDFAVRLGHALKHALLPAITLSGQIFGNLLGGAVIIEVLFGRPGLGRLLLQAINGKDTPVITGIVLISALAFVVMSFVVDAINALVDPRLKTEVEN